MNVLKKVSARRAFSDIFRVVATALTLSLADKERKLQTTATAITQVVKATTATKIARWEMMPHSCSSNSDEGSEMEDEVSKQG